MNNQQKSSKKPLIIFIIIILIAIFYYFYSKGNSSISVDSSSQLQEQSTNSETLLVGSRVLSLLNQINSLKIDPNIFSSNVYKSLVDYTIEVPEQNVGRINPFAPLPGSVPVSNTGTPRISSGNR